MPQPNPMGSPESHEGQRSGRPTPWYRKRATIVAGTVAIVLAVVAVLVLIVPTYAARWYLADQFDSMGIQADGVDSLDVDVLSGEVEIGPLEVWSGRAEPALIRGAGLDLDYGALLDGHLLLRNVSIRGVDLTVTWTDSGRLAVNGIDPDQLMAPSGEEQTQQPDQQSQSAWPMGVGEFVLRQAEVTLKPPGGEPLTFEIERVRLEDLKSWEPEPSGPLSFAVAGDGLEVDGSGRVELRPGALVVHANEGIVAENLSKLASLLPSARADVLDGAARLQLEQTLVLNEDGPTLLSATGTGDVSRLDVRASGAEASLAEASVELDALELNWSEAGLEAEGAVTSQLTDLRLDPGAGTVMEVGNATAALPDLAMTLPADAPMRFSGAPRLRTEAVTLSGPIEVSAEAAVVDLADFVFDPGGDGADVSAEGSAKLTSARVAAAGNTMRLASGSLALRDLRMDDAAGGLRIEAQPQVTMSGVEMAGAVQATADQMAIDLSQLVVASPGLTGASGGGGEPLQLSAEGVLRMDAASARAGDTGIRAASAELDLRDLEVSGAGSESDRPIMRGRPLLTVQGPRLSGPTPAAAETFRLDLSDLEVTTAGAATTVAAEGQATLGGVRMPSADPRIAANAATLDLRAMTLELGSGGALQVRGKPRLTVRQASLMGDNRGSVDRLHLTLTSLRSRADGGRITVDANGDAKLQAAAFTLPEAGEQPALSGQVDALQTSFRELQAVARGAALDWQGELNIQISGLSGEVGDGNVARAEVGEVDVGEVRVGDGGEGPVELAAGEVAVADVDMVVTRKLIGAFASEDGAKQDGTSADVRLGRFHTVSDAEVTFRDRMIDPTVQSTLNIEDLQVRDLNTAKPEQQAQLRLIATLNEFTNLRLTGEASPFAEEPEFDLDARVEGFDLPEVSPYAREYAGVQVDSGQLTSDVDASAEDGALDATIDMTLNRLAVEKMSDDGLLGGIPVKTGLALLEGPNGKITLTLPVSGSLSDPAFDISQIIEQAIGGAVRSALGSAFKILFPPAGIAALLSKDRSAEVQDVPFEPGSADLSAQAQTVVEAYGELLKRRPKLSLSVCGRATGLDVGGQESLGLEPAGGGGDSADERATPQLRELALQRTRSVRRHLIEKQGLSADRVTTCRPQWDAESDDSPRAQVSL